MTNINLDLAVKLDGSETHMIAILVDSWGDKLIIPLNCEMSIEPANYFTPCAHCGNAVLECNFEAGSDCCDRCTKGHSSGFVPEVKIAGIKQQLTDVVRNLQEVKMELIGTKDMTTRIKVARQEAEDAFWAVIVKHFPEATDGQFLMSDMDEIMLSWVEHWVDNNVPKPESQTASYRGDREDLDEMHLHYSDTWHLMHTGGGCMVALTDNVVVAGNHNYIGVTSECVCVYTDTFDQDQFLMEPIADWTFGDNPTVLMNILDEFMDGAALWDTCKLFDDIMTLAKSGKC